MIGFFVDDYRVCVISSVYYTMANVSNLVPVDASFFKYVEKVRESGCVVCDGKNLLFLIALRHGGYILEGELGRW